MFDCDGEFIWFFWMLELKYGKLCGLSINWDGNLFVVDMYYYWMLVYILKGELFEE